MTLTVFTLKRKYEIIYIVS